jgi:hypothetical protein
MITQNARYGLDKETGFLHPDFGWDAKIIKETRFLGSGKGRIALSLGEFFVLFLTGSGSIILLFLL